MIQTAEALSFTSLKVDLCQDINGGFKFSRCPSHVCNHLKTKLLEHFLQGNALLRLSEFTTVFTEQFLQGNI